MALAAASETLGFILLPPFLALKVVPAMARGVYGATKGMTGGESTGAREGGRWRCAAVKTRGRAMNVLAVVATIVSRSGKTKSEVRRAMGPGSPYVGTTAPRQARPGGVMLVETGGARCNGLTLLQR